jgi:3-oxoacyl-[acyl-carrier protein] reductase/meso-butanediol dehydrogenase/(S,S)-butanediol dehydrogenase/diacetyl reductase
MVKNKRKTVVVTGGTRGIGLAIVRAFHAQGYTVIVGARTETSEIKKLGARVFFKCADVRRQEDHRKLVTACMDLTGRLDAYINCAGVSLWKSLQDVDDDFLNMLIDTNLKGVLWGSQAASNALKKDGCIINVSSLAGKRGSAYNSVYCATKFGVNGITQSLAKELGPRGIRVNSVCPVYIKTKSVVDALQEPLSPAAGKSVEDYLNKFARENSALKRLPTAEEVASVCLFLASQGASAITGQCINIDCGVLPQ